MLDPAAAWALHPAVSVRPEPFGALLYHFGNRKLSFLKDPALLEVVRQLDQQPSLTAAFEAAGVPPQQHPRYLTAVQTLVASDIVVPRSPAAPSSPVKESA